MKLKKIILWFLTLFFIFSVFAFFPSFSSIIFLAAAVLIFPIPAWQTFLSDKLGKLKVLIIVLLCTLGFVVLPPENTENPEIPETAGITDIDPDTAFSTDTMTPETTEGQPESSDSSPATEKPAESAPTNTQQPPSHPHQFSKATCTEPATCSVCGATDGKAAGHKWNAATCDKPKTCSVCGVTDGKAAGHKWNNATCDKPKTCSVCGLTDGKAAGHKWNNATCDKPKTCSVCGATDGKAAGHKWNAATCDKPKTCSVCGLTDGKAAGHQYSDEKCSVCGAKNPNYVAEEMVWVTKTGKKYHNKNNCGSSKDPTLVTLSEAKKRGCTPCKTCYSE